MAERSQPGVVNVALVAVAAATVVLGASALTSVLPDAIQRIVFHAPVAIVALVVGTAWVLWRVAARRPPEA